MAKKATTTKQNNNNEPGKFAMMKMFFTNERTRFITRVGDSYYYHLYRIGSYLFLLYGRG